MVRSLDFADGYQSASAPDQGVILTGGFGSYVNDAAFVAALTSQGGTLGAGNAYFNSVSGRMRVYTGSVWVEFNVSIDPNFFVPSYSTDGNFQTALTAAGGTLAVGARYWNTTEGELRVYSGTAYVRIQNLKGNVFRVGSYASDSAFAADLLARTGLAPVAGAAYWDSALTALKIYDGSSYLQVLFTSKAQVITNKDIDGGTAATTRRITVPKDTLTNLTALPRKEGSIYFDTVSKTFYVDDGTNLVATVGAAVSSVNGFAGVVVIGTDDVAEGVTNLYFTDLRAQTAVITQVITDGVTDKSPSEDAVFDALALKQDLSEKGQPNGYAELDGAGKIPTSQIPDTVLGAVDYQGAWNALTNTPDLGASSPSKGDYWVVDTAGTGGSLGGYTDWAVGDWAIFNGTIWQKVDNSEPVDDAIVDGETVRAPSQNAVFDALALKQNLSEKDQPNGYPGLDGSSQIDPAQMQDLLEDTLTNGETTKAPTSNAVFDGLALKKDLTQVEDEAHGGTNQTTYAKGDMLYASAANTLAKRAAPNLIMPYGKFLRFTENDVPEWTDAIDPSLDSPLWDDWIGDAVGRLRWLDADSGTGVSQTTLTNADTRRHGILELATGTTNGGIAARTLGGVTSGAFTSGYKLGGGLLYQEWLVYLPALATVTDDYRFDAGLVASTSLTPDQVKIQYNRATSGANWQLITQAASTTTTTDTGIAVAAATWTAIGFLSNAAGTSVQPYINRVAAGSPSVTNIPTAVIAPHVRIIKASASAVSHLAYVDYFIQALRLSTAR